MQPSLSAPESPRTSANRANALHSTGPRTESGKLRASQNALKHGLTARAPVLPREDPEAYRVHCENFHQEYLPQTPTETQLVQELADTAWRLNRVPQLEAELLSFVPNIMSSHRALATLSQHAQRLSRQFQKALQQLRLLQAERRQREAQQPSQIERIAPLSPPGTLQSIPENGFVFSAAEVEALPQLQCSFPEPNSPHPLKMRPQPFPQHPTGQPG